MVNWNMYTPWPFSDLFAELGDKVEVRDFAKYNFVTPIMKPESMSRSDVLNGVMRNYKRFYMRKTFLSYPWIKDRWKRRYMLGCLKAFLKSTVERRFYDLGRIGYRGQKDVDFKFDADKVRSAEQLVQIGRRKAADDTRAAAARVEAYGGGLEASAPGLLADEAAPGTIDAPIDAFLDPRGYARQQARQRVRA